MVATSYPASDFPLSIDENVLSFSFFFFPLLIRATTLFIDRLRVLKNDADSSLCFNFESVENLEDSFSNALVRSSFVKRKLKNSHAEKLKNYTGMCNFFY